MQLSASSLAHLQSIIDNACSDPKITVPNLNVTVVARDGTKILSHCGGKLGINHPEDLNQSHVFWIASCTKLVTGIAIMQLVEKDILRLDDGDQIESLCPELKSLKVFGPDGTLVEKKNKITLRMLLTHTAGFGYTFFNEKLRDMSYPAGDNELMGRMEAMTRPLLFQPGEGWEYGISIDWASIALERVTGLRLEDCFQTHIFKPLGLRNMTLLPTEEMKARLSWMHTRRPDGSIYPRDHLLRMPLWARTKEEKDRCYQSGGAGLFATPSDFCRILSILLNDGLDGETNIRLLKPETVSLMFENSIPHMPNFGRRPMPAAKPDLVNPLPEVGPAPGNPPQGWGLTFMLPGMDATGRAKSTAQWAGLPNQWWWCDREKGVAGLICTHLLPFADVTVLGLWHEIEVAVYKGLGLAGY